MARGERKLHLLSHLRGVHRHRTRAHGRYQQGQDVYFVDAAAGDYRLVPSSPMQTAGAPLPQDVADAIGVPVTATTPLGALQWPARPADPPPSPLTRPVFRLHHPVAGDQLFTLSSSEAANAEQNYGYVSDGVGFLAATSASAGIVAIFRLRHPATEDRLYTRNPAERDSAVDRYGYTFEGIGFYAASSSSPGLVPVHRLQLGSLHHYAVGDAERDAAVAAGWNYEYVAWYAAPPA